MTDIHVCHYCGIALDLTNFFQKRYGFCTSAHQDKYRAIGPELAKQPET